MRTPIIVVFLIFGFQASCMAQEEKSPPADLPRAFVAAASEGNTMSLLEIKFFSRDYQNEQTSLRIARLEKIVFGVDQTGALSKRLGVLVELTKLSEHKYLDYADKNTELDETIISDFSQSLPPRSLNLPQKISKLEHDLTGQIRLGFNLTDRVDLLEQQQFQKTFRQEGLVVRTIRLWNLIEGGTEEYATDSTNAVENITQDFSKLVVDNALLSGGPSNRYAQFRSRPQKTAGNAAQKHSILQKIARVAVKVATFVEGPDDDDLGGYGYSSCAFSGW